MRSGHGNDPATIDFPHDGQIEDDGLYPLSSHVGGRISFIASFLTDNLNSPSSPTLSGVTNPAFMSAYADTANPISPSTLFIFPPLPLPGRLIVCGRRRQAVNAVVRLIDYRATRRRSHNTTARHAAKIASARSSRIQQARAPVWLSRFPLSRRGRSYPFTSMTLPLGPRFRTGLLVRPV